MVCEKQPIAVQGDATLSIAVVSGVVGVLRQLRKVIGRESALPEKILAHL